MAPKWGIKFAVYLITNHFGKIVAKVCENLLDHGALTLDLVIRYTELSPEHVKNSLLVLIKHNCVQVFVAQGGDEDGSRAKTQYMVLFDNILHRLRFPKFIEIVSGELDDKCAKFFEGLLRDGILNTKQMVDRESQGKENAVAAAAVRESLLKLLMARYVERCPLPEARIVEGEIITKKRGAKGAQDVIVMEKQIQLIQALQKIMQKRT
ncbi:unnamed protein product [Vicia faba]|uniref:DNA-directed RNA polymerase III subunit RPC3 n=1 Tax=Vicia faba TaxID=3906 RepID=A0AAV0YCV5_VICFA|nr:unnamed protein product [Vicia faba]